MVQIIQPDVSNELLKSVNRIWENHSVNEFIKHYEFVSALVCTSFYSMVTMHPNLPSSSRSLRLMMEFANGYCLLIVLICTRTSQSECHVCTRNDKFIANRLSAEIECGIMFVLPETQSIVIHQFAVLLTTRLKWLVYWRICTVVSFGVLCYNWNSSSGLLVGMVRLAKYWLGIQGSERMI